MDGIFNPGRALTQAYDDAKQREIEMDNKAELEERTKDKTRGGLGVPPGPLGEYMAGRGVISDVVSPDAPISTNENGGMQSHAPVRFDLVDAKALFATAAVLHEGAEKYAPGNWRLIPVRDHLNHLLMHTYAYLSGDRSDDHLSHAVCRAIFALGVDLDPDATPEKDQ